MWCFDDLWCTPSKFSVDVLTACRNVSRERNRETHLIILVNTSIYKLEMMAWKKVWYFNCCYFSNFRKEWHVSHHFSPKARVHQCQPPCCQGIFRAAAARAAVGTSRDEWVKKFHGAQEICWRLSEESCANSRRFEGVSGKMSLVIESFFGDNWSFDVDLLIGDI